MTSHTRKLLIPLQDHNPTFFSSKDTPTPSITSKSQERENPTNYSSRCYDNFKLHPPFDSAMALTVLVLLTALFFMGFFSIYIRRFADDSSVDPSRRRRSSNSPETLTTSYISSSRSSPKGADPTVVKSLPVHAFVPGEAKQGVIEEMECAICLSEFEEKEWVKEIPYCGHVFHVVCIDTWLSTRLTCPLCRTAKLLVVEEREKEGMVKDGHVAGGEEMEMGLGLGVSEVQGDVDSDGGGGEGGE